MTTDFENVVLRKTRLKLNLPNVQIFMKFSENTFEILYFQKMYKKNLFFETVKQTCAVKVLVPFRRPKIRQF